MIFLREHLERVLYFASYIVLDTGETDLQYKQVLSENRISGSRKRNTADALPRRNGCRSYQGTSESIDLEKEYAELKAELGRCDRTEAEQES